MQDESEGSYLTGMVALRSKSYSLRVQDAKNPTQIEIDSKSKGVNRVNVKAFSFQNYRDCLHQDLEIKTKLRNIRAFSHKIVIQDQIKIALSCKETKRYVLDCKVHTIPFGMSKTAFHCDRCEVKNKFSDIKNWLKRESNDNETSECKKIKF